MGSNSAWTYSESMLVMRTFFTTLAIAAMALVSTHIASAQSTFEAFLTGLGENPPNASPATGFGTVVLSADQTMITVNESWSGLLSPATGSHIHGPAGAGTNALILFPFSGVPNATAGAIPEQTFAITPTQVGYLFAGFLYMNVHDAVFPGGEIRGQLLLVPEPSSAALLGMGLLVAMKRLRRRAAH